ncbi:MAG TPA: hypothetical protein VE549_03115, partial [Myxococcaceae bacterium]|nr:hypothetical protein [Myxococcaceae bacterium]
SRVDTRLSASARRPSRRAGDVIVASVDPFVRRLIQRMHDPARPLSRNRHFHTFATPEGRLALRTSRRLRNLQEDILAARAEGARSHFLRHQMANGQHRIEIALERLSGRRVSFVSDAEFELLLELPGVRAALEEARGAA